jgi:hypothetical protein
MAAQEEWELFHAFLVLLFNTLVVEVEAAVPMVPTQQED